MALFLSTETKIRGPLEDHWGQRWKQLHIHWPHSAALQWQVGVSKRQTEAWLASLWLASNPKAFKTAHMSHYFSWINQIFADLKGQLASQAAKKNYRLMRLGSTRSLWNNNKTIAVSLTSVMLNQSREDSGSWSFWEGCRSHSVWNGAGHR